MAEFKKVQHPTETSSLTKVNQTVQGASHPIAQKFVDKVIQKAISNKLRKKVTDPRDFEEGRDGLAFGTIDQRFRLNTTNNSSLLNRRRKKNP